MATRVVYQQTLITWLLTACAVGIFASARLAASSGEEAPAQVRRTLTLAQRVAYQHAIENVYWRHRIWPKGNAAAKPPLNAVLSREQVEAKVAEYLWESNALELYWRQPLTDEQLQGEMQRMARNTRDAEMLRELFDALESDPFLIAECLARPALSRQLVSDLYAYDERFHGELRRQAETDLHEHPTIEELRQSSGVYNEVEFVQSDSPAVYPEPGNARLVELKSGDWDETVGRLAAILGPAANDGVLPPPPLMARITTGVVSPLQEDATRYYVTAVLHKAADRVTVATVEWSKEPLASLRAREGGQPIELRPSGTTKFTLPEISGEVGGCADGTWKPTTSVPPPRSGHTAVWTGSEMIVWGADVSGSTGGRYNPVTDTWTPTNRTNAPSPRNEHTAVWTGSQMIVWGGLDSGGGILTGGKYNPASDSWTATTTMNAPARRRRHTAVWTGTQMIVWGGFDPNSSITNTGGKYSPDTDSWTATATADAPSARANHTAVWTDNEMIVWGGGSSLDTGGRYDPGSDTWTSTPTANAPSGRFWHSVLWSGTEMIVWGGSIGGIPQNTGGRYNPSANTWAPTSMVNAPSSRYQHTAVWTGSEMIVWGGNGALNTGGRYNPIANSWTATGLTNAPSGRGSHSAVWTGSRMIVWGGNDLNLLSTGGRYDPIADSWTSTSTTNAPSPRGSHTSVWTGSEMIVWGGGTSGLSTGARYDPAMDRWTPTPMAGAPAARYVHTAIWTGREMIVWGGLGSSYFATGGQYNPGADTWTPVSTDNAPGPRGYHTAVWTGSEMAIWGGYGNGAPTNTGGMYNPRSDSWRPTTLTNAPTTRRDHTAVWTGREMIVWGGFNDLTNSRLNTGGRYDPGTDTWMATSPTNAPNARTYPKAVWTGSEMLVWGGSESSGAINTGRRYNPVTDTWGAMATSNAPTARYRHSIIWTGTEVIVWGGTSSSFGLNSGARYNPAADAWTPTSLIGAPEIRYDHTAVWTGSQMVVWGGTGANNNSGTVDTGGQYCAAPSAPVVQSAVSRKVHGNSGTYEVALPLSGTPGIECRSGGASNDYILVITFLANVAVTGNPQATVTSGTAAIGSGGVSSGGMIETAGNVVTIPLTQVANAQTINITLNGVNGPTAVVIPMCRLLGDINGDRVVNSGDVLQTRNRSGQTTDSVNFRSDVNADGFINSGDVLAVRGQSGQSVP